MTPLPLGCYRCRKLPALERAGGIFVQAYGKHAVVALHDLCFGWANAGKSAFRPIATFMKVSQVSGLISRLMFVLLGSPTISIS
jgi:hypothetical protein